MSVAASRRAEEHGRQRWRAGARGRARGGIGGEKASGAGARVRDGERARRRAGRHRRRAEEREQQWRAGMGAGQPRRERRDGADELATGGFTAAAEMAIGVNAASLLFRFFYIFIRLTSGPIVHFAQQFF